MYWINDIEYKKIKIQNHSFNYWLISSRKKFSNKKLKYNIFLSIAIFPTNEFNLIQSQHRCKKKKVNLDISTTLSRFLIISYPKLSLQHQPPSNTQQKKTQIQNQRLSNSPIVDDLDADVVAFGDRLGRHPRALRPGSLACNEKQGASPRISSHCFFSLSEGTCCVYRRPISTATTALARSLVHSSIYVCDYVRADARYTLSLRCGCCCCSLFASLFLECQSAWF